MDIEFNTEMCYTCDGKGYNLISCWNKDYKIKCPTCMGHRLIHYVGGYLSNDIRQEIFDKSIETRKRLARLVYLLAERRMVAPKIRTYR